MQSLLEKYGPWALVTGASSGIGEAFARILAQNGFNLIITARRDERLEKLANSLMALHGIRAKPVHADLSKLDFLPILTQAAQDLEIGLLVNNAGFSIVGEFLENDLDREIELLHVNCRAALMLTHVFGSYMAARKRGGIIQVSSIAGFTPSPYWSGYSVSKSYVLRLAECLAEEFKPYNIDVMALCPGGTTTEFEQVSGADYSHASALARQAVGCLSADEVAAFGLHSLGKRRVAIIGWRNVIMTRLAGLLPRIWNLRIAGWVINNTRKKSKT